MALDLRHAKKQILQGKIWNKILKEKQNKEDQNEHGESYIRRK